MEGHGVKPGERVFIKRVDRPATNGSTPVWCNQWFGKVVRLNAQTVTVEFEVDELGRKTVQRYIDYQDICRIEE